MPSFDFFSRLKRWSQRKHRLLGKYLPPFSAKVARTTSRREIYIVDGFAGAAAYDDGSKGSPLLIAEFGDVCATWRNSVNLRLINVEEDKDDEGIFERLERETAQWVPSGRVKNIRKDFGDAVPEILAHIGGEPALFFVDPFGPTDLRFHSLKPILARRGSVTELIINFDHDGLRRIVDAALSPNTDRKTAETNAKNITAIIGSDSWREQIEGKNLSSGDAEQILLRIYCDNIADYGFTVVAYPIREELDSNPKYHFVYCTRHPDGLLLMNDFVREEEDQIYGDHVDGNFPLLSETSAANELSDRRSRLRQIVEQYAQATKSFKRGQVKSHLVSSYFGEFHSKDYNAVVKELLGDRIIVSSSGKPRINDDDPLTIK